MNQSREPNKTLGRISTNQNSFVSEKGDDVQMPYFLLLDNIRQYYSTKIVNVLLEQHYM